MDIVCVIPARYNSSRFKGKPLANILGKPMIWWVYQNAKKVNAFSDVIVATDDDRIMNACKENDIKAIKTSEIHNTPLDRIHEVSDKINADYYMCINGDEPLLKPSTMEELIPLQAAAEGLFVSNAMTIIKNPAEVIDFTNLKIVNDVNGNCIYISRSPIPYPKGSIDFNYKKYVGITVLNKKALDFYVSTKRGILESIEDNDLLRYIENGEKVKLVEVDCDVLSVDTKKDLDKVIDILNSQK